MDADRRTTPEDEFEKEMLYFARKHGQESAIMTRPSRGIAHLSFTNEEETSLQLTRAGFGAGAFQRLKNQQLAVQQGAIPSGGDHTRVSRRNPHHVWTLEQRLLPISRPTMGFMSLGRVFLSGLYKDGRRDVEEAIQDHYSYDGLRVHEEKWWRDISKEERRWGLEMDRRIMEKRREFDDLERGQYLREARVAIDEMYALVDEFRAWRQSCRLEDGGGKSRSRRCGVDRGWMASNPIWGTQRQLPPPWILRDIIPYSFRPNCGRFRRIIAFRRPREFCRPDPGPYRSRHRKAH